MRFPPPAMGQIDVKTLGKLIRRARTRAGLSQAALAEAAGVADETVSRVERGAYEPSLSTLVRLADALGENVDFVVRRSSRAAEAGGEWPPLVRQLADRAALLDVDSQRALLRLAGLLPVRRRKP
jgi:transcriptional regulator with XRE-family HTH domain